MADALTIRSAVPTDAPVLCELLGQLGYPASESEIPARLSAVANFPRAEAFVATNGYGEVVGLGSDKGDGDGPPCFGELANRRSNIGDQRFVWSLIVSFENNGAVHVRCRSGGVGGGCIALPKAASTFSAW